MYTMTILPIGRTEGVLSVAQVFHSLNKYCKFFPLNVSSSSSKC